MPKTPKAKIFSCFLPNERATNILASELAKIASQKDIILLEGEFGAGKTSFARAFVRYLMQNSELDVPSPSFAIIQPYENVATGQKIIHADLYRISNDYEIEELGLLDEQKAIIVIEWWQNAPLLLDIADWKIKLEIAPDGEGRGELSRQRELGGQRGRIAHISALKGHKNFDILQSNLKKRGLKPIMNESGSNASK